MTLVYRCGYCGREFRTWDAQLQHQAEKHEAVSSPATAEKEEFSDRG